MALGARYGWRVKAGDVQAGPRGPQAAGRVVCLHGGQSREAASGSADGIDKVIAPQRAPQKFARGGHGGYCCPEG